MKIKKFKNVQIGDTVVDADCHGKIGTVVWKGSFKEGIKNQPSNYTKSEYKEWFSKKELKNLNMVTVRDGFDVLLMVYDFDPSSAVVLKEEKPKSGLPLSTVILQELSNIKFETKLAKGNSISPELIEATLATIKMRFDLLEHITKKYVDTEILINVKKEYETMIHLNTFPDNSF